jgi:hypothetical protein
MAFPYTFEENFELGTRGGFDSETDVNGSLNFRHYSYLARYDTTQIGGIAPWRGAYCVELDLTGETADHTLIEANVVADTKVAFASFYVFFGKDFRATADDTLNIFEFQSAAAVQGVVGITITAATQAITIGTGKIAPTVFGAQPLERGKWYHISLATDVETGGTGTSTLYVDGVQVAQVTTITNIALTTTAFGVRGALATTFGHIFLDCFIMDDTGAEAAATRFLPMSDRYPEIVMMTMSGHLALGNSELLNVTLIAGNGTNNILKIYDTDNATVTDESNVVAYLNNLTALEPPIDLADVPQNVKRGVYVQLAGTAPRALIHIGKSQGWFSHGRVRQHGFNHKPSNQVTQ